MSPLDQPSPMLDFESLVRAAESLDPVPASVTQLVRLISNDDWAFRDVEAVISLDPALTGRVLQVANSAASATLMPIGTVKDAVIRVGIGPVVSFAMAWSIGPRFRRALPEYGLSEGQLWKHSVAAALAAEIAAAMTPLDVPPEAVTAALLHDVGKLVLARFLTAPLLERLATAREHGDVSSLQAETAVLGVHHGQLGGIIARHWNLPDRMAEAITHHHEPDRAADVVCDIVHVANIAARQVAGPDFALPADATPAGGTMTRLQLEPNHLDRLCSHVARRLDEVHARYSAVAEGSARRPA